MAVSKEITRLEQSNVTMTVTISKEDVGSQYDELLAGYSKSLQIPGFRKGKVPREVLERKFGSSLKDEALSRIIEKSVADIFADEDFPVTDKPLPYAAPQLQDTPKLDFDEDLRFSITYDVLPTVKVGTWKGLTVEVPDVSVGDEDIDRELETIRNRNAIVQDKEDDAVAENDDVVTVNYQELSETGEPLEDTKREDFVFTLGSGYNMYRFDEEIQGMKKGETREIEKVYPEDFIDKELAGRTIKLRVSLTALKSKSLPDLDDEFAQDVDEKYETLEDLKTEIRRRFDEDLEKRLRDTAVSGLLEQIMENSPTEFPESMILLELEARLRNMAAQLQTSPEELLRIMGNSGKTYEEITAEWRPGVLKALHRRLVLETLIGEQNITVSDEEKEQEFAKLAEDNRMSLEEIRQYYEQESMQSYLEQSLKERRFFDLLIAENTVTKGEQQALRDFVQ